MNTDILKKIDPTWTLFLDRDGVINHEKRDDYVLNAAAFRFYDGVIEALEKLGKIFGTIVVVTNQRGIGRQRMTEADLAGIHSLMMEEVEAGKGRIDKIYHCSSLDDDCFERKPNPGMAHLAKNDFPHINFGKSIMVGNRLSDMRFGRNAGMYTVYVDTTHPEAPDPHPDIDFRFTGLAAFADTVSRFTTR